jgi:hypothetical protein
MKKLIGLLGAAGLLLPSAAVAGGITQSVGSDALRITGASTSFTAVRVSSDIHKNNTVGIAGRNWGHSIDASAENLSYGSRDMDYNYDRQSGQAAGNLAADIEGRGGGRTTTEFSESYSDESRGGGGGIIYGDVTRTEENTPAQPAEPGKLCGRLGCIVGPVEATPETSSTNVSGYVVAAGGGGSQESGESEFTETTTTNGGGSLEGVATANGTIDGASASSYGHGHEHFVDGAGTVSYDGYENGYIGVLHESGDTHTNITALTSASDTKRGFSTSSFQDSSWN